MAGRAAPVHSIARRAPLDQRECVTRCACSATSRSSSTSASPRCLAGIPWGTRNPVRYQLDGRTQPGRRSSASGCPAHGPMRSSRSARTISSRTSADSVRRAITPRGRRPLPASTSSMRAHPAERRETGRRASQRARARPQHSAHPRECFKQLSNPKSDRFGRSLSVNHLRSPGNALSGAFWFPVPQKMRQMVHFDISCDAFQAAPPARMQP